jgi:hypothetical protein
MKEERRSQPNTCLTTFASNLTSSYQIVACTCGASVKLKEIYGFNILRCSRWSKTVKEAQTSLRQLSSLEQVEKATEQ